MRQNKRTRRSARSLKNKGKRFENKVARIIHETLYEVNPQYRELFDKLSEYEKQQLKPARDILSGISSAQNLGDIRLNIASQFFRNVYPIFECKNWEQFKKINIFDLFRRDAEHKIQLLLEQIFQNELLNNMDRFTQAVSSSLADKEKARKVELFPVLVFSANRVREPLVYFDPTYNRSLIPLFTELLKRFVPTYIQLNCRSGSRVITSLRSFISVLGRPIE